MRREKRTIDVPVDAAQPGEHPAIAALRKRLEQNPNATIVVGWLEQREDERIRKLNLLVCCHPSDIEGAELLAHDLENSLKTPRRRWDELGYCIVDATRKR